MQLTEAVSEKNKSESLIRGYLGMYWRESFEIDFICDFLKIFATNGIVGSREMESRERTFSVRK